MIADASVLRNFGVLGWAAQLVLLADRSLWVAHGVIGLGGDPVESGEVEGIREALQRTADRHPGLGVGSRALAAVQGLDDLLGRRGTGLRVAILDAHERALAVRLQSRHAADRAWRRDDLGLRARRLDLGEAVSIAVAVHRGLALACDEDDGRRAYAALTGRSALRTLDLLERAVDRGLLDVDVARKGYRELLDADLHRFGGPPWEE